MDVHSKQRVSETSSDNCPRTVQLNSKYFRKVRNWIRNFMSSSNRKPIFSDSFTFYTTVVFVSLCMIFVRHMDNQFPRPLTREDSKTNSELFIEERAKEDLVRLTGIGPRVTGSYQNEIVTISILNNILQNIKNESTESNNLEWEVHTPSGAFQFRGTQTYGKITNFLVKLEPKRETLRTGHSILFNCHFDSGSGSPGASDDMINCASMLEVIRVLSKKSVNLVRNTLIFLFNGAEEMGLLGSHGFVAGSTNSSTESGHRWAKNVKSLVNLEGAGAGGRSILFQSGPGNSWLLELYAAAVPHPFTTVIAEEAFQRKLIPSDTDFRIFRDYGNVTGLDISFIKNGWVYHTNFDNIGQIPAGCIQHSGDNLLALAIAFGEIDFSTTENNDEKMVFFDVFGLFVVHYSETVGIVLNALVAAAVIVGISWFDVVRPKKYMLFLWFFGSSLLAWGVSIAVAIAIGALMNTIGYYSPFHSYPSLVLLIFGLPAILTQVIVYAMILRGNEEHAWAAGKITMAVLTIVGTFITRAVYLFTIILLFSTSGWYIAKLIFKRNPKMRLLLYLIFGEMIPLSMIFYIQNLLLDVFVPIMGRSGPGVNPNVTLALITGAVTSIIAFNGIVALVVGMKKRHLISTVLISILIINVIVVIGYIGKIPYQNKTSMRLSLIDTHRIWYNTDQTSIGSQTDHGILFWPDDPNTEAFMPTFEASVPEIHGYQELDININLCKDLACAIPFATSEIRKEAYWLSKESDFPEDWYTENTVRILEKVKLNSTTWRLHLSFGGPTQILVVLSPGPKYTLMEWDIPTQEKVPLEGPKWKGRETYNIFHSRGYDNLPLEVTVILERKAGRSDNNEVANILLDINHASLYLYEPQLASPGMKKFMKKFPDWVNINIQSSILQFYRITET